MFSSLFARLFRHFGARYSYDTDYLETMAHCYPGKAWRYILSAPFSQHRGHAPAAACFSAKLRSAHLSGCGPCVRLVFSMAIEANVAAPQLQAVLTNDVNGMNAETLLGYRYATAVHQQSDELPALITDIEVHYGLRGLWDMALAVAFGQFYPVTKRGLGVAAACESPETLVRELDVGS